jgi:transketolase
MRVDGHDVEAIEAAIGAARAAERPTLIACKTVIGFGAPKKAGTSKAHGEPLGPGELSEAKIALNLSPDPFSVAGPVLENWRLAGQRSQGERAAWDARLAGLDEATRAAFLRRIAGVMPAALAPAIAALKQSLADTPQTVATRKASELALEAIMPVVPELVLGSADLTPSNNTRTTQARAVTAGDFSGRYIHYGIREHAMAAAMNGIALHGGLVPAGATFMVFTDYCRPAIRLSALMGVRVIYVMTHDSIGLGEDGPTHQPVEHLAALRAIPNLHVFRPADATETAECWELALNAATTPSVLALTRQNVAPARVGFSAANLCARGAYELKPAEGEAQVSLFASGSEVEIALAARELLTQRGVGARVVSVTCLDLFQAQPSGFRADVIGQAPVKVAIEAGIRMPWDAIIGADGVFVGMTGFGASAPYKELYAHFGITPEAAAEQALAKLRPL